MYYDVLPSRTKVNTMDQDVALGVTMTITQADIPFLREAGRLGEYAVVYRAYRHQMGGGFGDQAKHPFAWGVLVYVDAQVARINSARGLAREWSDLTRLEKWMREQGFWYWWMRNDLEPLHMSASDDTGQDDASEPSPAPVDGGLGNEGTPEDDVVPLPTQLFNLIPDTRN